LPPRGKWKSYSKQPNVNPVVICGSDESHEMQQVHLMNWNQV
jgi:hypothetical protein